MYAIKRNCYCNIIKIYIIALWVFFIWSYFDYCFCRSFNTWISIITRAAIKIRELICLQNSRYCRVILCDIIFNCARIFKPLFILVVFLYCFFIWNNIGIYLKSEKIIRRMIVLFIYAESRITSI